MSKLNQQNQTFQILDVLPSIKAGSLNHLKPYKVGNIVKWNNKYGSIAVLEYLNFLSGLNANTQALRVSQSLVQLVLDPR